MRADDRVDAPHHEVLDAVSLTDPPHPIQVALDVALPAHYYEQIAEQAVSVAKRLDYLAAGTGRRHTELIRNPCRPDRSCRPPTVSYEQPSASAIR